MATIKAPFNFVPVSENVFFPDWSDQITHDIPFEDGESGTIELKITAESPIFVRNGHTKEQATNNDDEYKSFSKIDDRYFIPATTIKGAVRSVMEIMSFGKMRLDKNAMFAQREWNNRQLYPMKTEQNNLSCGYLKRKGDDYEVIDCGKPYRIGLKRIDEETNTQIFYKEYSKEYAEKHRNQKLSDEQKTAKYKYQLLKNHSNLFDVRNYSIDSELANEHKNNRVTFSNSGEIRGRLVLTGQPDRCLWKRPKQLNPAAGKFYEFVFEEKHPLQIIPFSKQDYEHFKFIYLESSEWSRMKDLLENDGIPVFFRKNESGGIKDLGMAFLYKLPYEHSPFETLKADHKKSDMDLADCIFGSIDDAHPLKGRVQFSHAFSDAKVVPVGERIITLGSPKASYYPLYIRQNGGTVVEYATYNQNGQISGWKRYLIRENIWGIKDVSDPKLDSILLPLDKGIAFSSKIRYHNLKKVELGALLSALTFHNTDGCLYQLGQGKPYGFGKVKIQITNIQQNIIDSFLFEFEKMIEKHTPNWSKSVQIKELLTMSKLQISENENDKFTYLKMDNSPSRNEFLIVKNSKEALLPYSTIINNAILLDSLVEKRKKTEYEGLINEFECLKNDSKFEEAKEKLQLASDLFPNDTILDEKLAEINRLIDEKARELAEIKRREEQLHRDKEIIEGGLSFLEELSSNREYKVKDFNGAKSRIDRWMKKAGISKIPDDQFDLLKTALKRLCQNRKEQKDWLSFESYIWRSIKGFVGDVFANQLYLELINNKFST